MFKFRTMISDAEKKLEELKPFNEMDGPVFKIKNDPRITKFGKFLRKTGLDEIPQIWNIVKGEMSFVGPRPALKSEVANYKEEWKKRLNIKPGLTCYWQITPNRNSLSFEDWYKMDLRYIEERCILVDLKIILKTFGAVLRSDGE